VFPGQRLDNPYSLNTVDVCPVGALTSSVFRFKQRVWNLSRSPSLCGGCARGCNVHVDHRSCQVYRLLPRENDEVNKSWLCDEGRLTYARANTDRLTHALVRRSGAREAEREEISLALKSAGELLKPFWGNASGLLWALSLHATCEEAYLVSRLAKEVSGATEIALIEYAPGPADQLLRVADRNPNRAGVNRVLTDLNLRSLSEGELIQRLSGGGSKGLILLGHQTSRAIEVAQAASSLEVFVHIAHARTALAEVAQVTLPSLSWVQTDGTWINVDQRAQRLWPAFSPQDDVRSAAAWIFELAALLNAKLTAASMQTVRAEIMRHLASFAQSQLMDIGPQGRVLSPIKQA
jgi:NADH-quinone oxidoreductase subunit G